jgi:hypothetical protein
LASFEGRKKPGDNFVMGFTAQPMKLTPACIRQIKPVFAETINFFYNFIVHFFKM